MRSDWQTKKLGEICDFQNGFAFKSKFFKQEGYPVLRISNIQNDEISYNKLVFFDKKDYFEDFDKYKVNKGDLVIAMSGATTGKIAISGANEVFYLNQRVGKFIPKKDLSKDYLYYFLSTKIEENLHISSGAAQPNLSTEQIRNFKIPFPSLSEQQHIVKVLDEAFEKIEKVKQIAEKNLQNSKNIFESYLLSTFANKGNNWEENKISKIADLIDSLHQTPKYSSDGIPMVRVTDIKTGILNITSAKKVDESIFKEFSKKHIPSKGDIVFSRVGSYGVSSYVDSDEPFCLGQNTVFIVAKINSKFLYFFLNSPNAKKQIDKLVAGTTQPTISLKSINEIVVPIPPLQIQNKIVETIELMSIETKKLESISKQKLADLEELKKSILNKAFSGEL